MCPSADGPAGVPASHALRRTVKVVSCPAVQRARNDFAQGRGWKARDRLFGAVAGYPADQEVLDLLGEVLYDMGDLPSAGRYWMLTAREGPPVEAAITALFEQCGGSALVVAQRLPIVAPSTAYPPAVHKRLAQLPADALRWRQRRNTIQPEATSGGWLAGLVASVAAGTFILILVLGVVKAIELLWP